MSWFWKLILRLFANSLHSLKWNKKLVELKIGSPFSATEGSYIVLNIYDVFIVLMRFLNYYLEFKSVQERDLLPGTIFQLFPVLCKMIRQIFNLFLSSLLDFAFHCFDDHLVYIFANLKNLGSTYNKIYFIFYYL